jgi:hypothetical protein
MRNIIGTSRWFVSYWVIDLTACGAVERNQTVHEHSDQQSNNWARPIHNCFTVKVTVVCDISLCSLIEIGRRFTRSYCLHQQGGEYVLLSSAKPPILQF